MRGGGHQVDKISGSFLSVHFHHRVISYVIGHQNKVNNSFSTTFHSIQSHFLIESFATMPPNPCQKEASAKKGRNQHTGPRNPSTPPEKKDPFEGTIRGTKRKNEHYDHSNTPRKAEVLSIVRWEDSKPFKKRAKREDIFKFCGVSETRGYAIIQEKEGQLPATARTFHNDPRKEETRGSKSQLTEEHLKKLEDLITSNGFDGRALSWDALAEELEVPGRKEGTYLSGKTIQRHMRERGWKHCIACRKHWLSDDTCDRRVEWAKYMLEKYPEKEDWWKVLFSDEKEASAKKGRNQHTGPRNPSTPPEKKDPFEGTIRGTKRKNEHYDHSNTPRKAEVLSIVRWEDSKPFKKRAKREDIFKFCGVSETRGYAIIQEKEGQLPATARTFHNDPRKEETRGSKSQLTEEHLKKLEDLITSNGFDGRALSWDALAEELEVPGRKEGTYLSGKTIQRHMRERGWKHCIACRKHWLSDDTCDRRVEWAKYMLEKYPEKEDWWKVLFSDEVHFSFGPQGRIYILRRPSERNCPDCIQQQQQKKKKRKSKSKGKSTKEGDEVGEEPDLDYKLHA
ncbi:hypothetical protein HYFRA_00008666 [Hymenoscyphus fraxineus]|uniref:Transposase Tc1-like domain-containing protein n=1 Tax=Hymenoscyphus fraxineus TaxID=746836 RepID=A0A9N9KZT2_9HELO|nr:hypothetical protein HYFRA_00008666 [Hymenoscyphus fraxineus]